MDEEERDLPVAADEGGKPAKKAKGKKGKNKDEDDEGGALSVILVTIFIVAIWLAILALLVKLDVGGFGSSVLTPVLKDIPVVNKILPGYPNGLSGNSVSENGEYSEGGYQDIDSAVARIRELEMQLDVVQDAVNSSQEIIANQQEEINRLHTFEENQVEFEKIKDEFYNEVVFGAQAPDISEYQKYYESIDPTNAQILYKQVVKQEQRDTEIENYAKAYSAMKAKDAAEIFDTDIIMKENGLDTVVTILEAMGTDARGQILAQMNPENAAAVTRRMKPDPVNSTTVTSAPPAIVTPEPAAPQENAPEENPVADNGAGSEVPNNS
ncbi:MAG: hypothetical protein J6P05_01960 [Lachnospiraceae bacterium]|nr:hypothetical protein [Lachnospiraceae bacterium]